MVMIKQSGVSMLLDGGVMQPTNFDVLEDRGLASPTKLTAVAETLNKFRQKHRLTLLPMPQVFDWYGGWTAASSPPRGADGQILDEVFLERLHVMTAHRMLTCVCIPVSTNLLTFGFLPTENKDDWMLLTAETLHIMRPVVYALALSKWGKQKWRPWLLSLAMDLTSTSLYTTYQQTAIGWLTVDSGACEPYGTRQLACALLKRFGLFWTTQNGGRLSRANRTELVRRQLLLVYYLMRSPCFDKGVHPPLRLIESGLGRVPLVGGLYSKVLDIMVAVQGYYFYTSAS
eukprot:1182907-Prorocentrum_minimum.AAC.10